MDHDAAAAFRAGPRHRDRHELMRRGRCVSSRHMRCQCPIALVYSTTLSCSCAYRVCASTSFSARSRNVVADAVGISVERALYHYFYFIFFFCIKHRVDYFTPNTAMRLCCAMTSTLYIYVYVSLISYLDLSNSFVRLCRCGESKRGEISNSRGRSERKRRKRER